MKRRAFPLFLVWVAGCAHQTAAPAGPQAGDFHPSDMEDVKATVVRNFPQLTLCYEKAVRRDPRTEGRVEAEWSVAKGRVTEVSVVKNTTGDDELGDCVARKISRWSFPTRLEGEVLYPFIFKAAPE